MARIHEERSGVDVNLGFTLDIRLRGDRKGKPIPRRIDFGALVQPGADKKFVRNASNSLIICRTADPATSPLVRIRVRLHHASTLGEIFRPVIRATL